MANKLRTKISWKTSRTRQVVGYRLYWTKGETLNYRSKCADIGNVNEIVLPDALASFNLHQGPLKFGLTAVNKEGNESDILTIGSLNMFYPPSPKRRRPDPQSQEPWRKSRQSREPLRKSRQSQELWQTEPPEQSTVFKHDAAQPVACFSDPVRQRLFLQLNLDQSQANHLDRASGLQPLLAYGNTVSRKTLRETKNVLIKIKAQLDQVFPED